MTGDKVAEDDAEQKKEKKIEIVVRELDVLLRKRFGNDLIVESLTTGSLVPVGENYGSSMLKIDVTIRRERQGSEAEELFLVAKMTPPTEFQKQMFTIPQTFPKEIYMFEGILPAYKALEHECGIPDDEGFDSFPELYGARLSLNNRVKFDHDAMILMENLKVKNYYCADRQTGIDSAHARLVVETLARFHALGIAMKFKKEQLFDEFRVRAESALFRRYLTLSKTDAILERLTKIAAVRPYLARVEENFRNFVIGFRGPAEPWSTITHGDLWINNIMFRDEANGDPRNVKLLDFQCYQFLNPLQDLVFLIFTSCKTQVWNEHLNRLFDLYYEKFTSHLTRLKCDVKFFSRGSFDEQLTIVGNFEYVHCLGVIDITGTKVDNPHGTITPEMMSNPQLGDDYQERLTDITLHFVKANWI